MAQNLNQEQIKREIAIIQDTDETVGLNQNSRFSIEDIFKYVSNFNPSNFTNNFTAYKIKKDVNVEPIKTLKRLDDKINGIYFGFGKTSGRRQATILFLAPITVNILFDPTDNHIYTQTYHFIKENNSTIAFNCIDPKEGIWESTTLEALNPLIERHKKSFSGKAQNRRYGFYVGKLAFENTFYQTNNASFVYIGKGLQLNPIINSKTSYLQLFFTEKPFFHQNTTIGINLGTNPNTNTIGNQSIKVACTVGIIDNSIKTIPQNGTPPFQPHNHATIRPCPTVCPQ